MSRNVIRSKTDIERTLEPTDTERIERSFYREPLTTEQLSDRHPDITTASIETVCSRLAKRGVLRRLGLGVYQRVGER